MDKNFRDSREGSLKLVALRCGKPQRVKKFRDSSDNAEDPPGTSLCDPSHHDHENLPLYAQHPGSLSGTFYRVQLSILIRLYLHVFMTDTNRVPTVMDADAFHHNET